MNDTTAVLQEPSGEQRQREPTLGRHVILRALIGGSLVVGGIAFVVPRVLGVDVASVLSSLGGVSIVDVLALSAIWFLGVFVHSFVLTGALPGLTRIRALMLNLTGSALSNVIPFGGAASTALNFKMARTWSVSVAGFAAFALIANVWWIAVKLALPLCAVALLVVMGGLHNGTILWAASASTIALAAVATGLALAAGGHSAGVVGRIAAMLSRVANAIGRPCTPQQVTSTIDAARESTRLIVASRWRQLCLAMFGYAMFQAVLLGACLHVVGAGQTWHVVFAAYAIDRVLTLAVFMPGAAGVAELGTAAVLVALGGPPAATAAGVLLYRAFTFGIEIPIGGAWLLGWLAARSMRRRRREIAADVATGQA